MSVSAPTPFRAEYISDVLSTAFCFVKTIYTQDSLLKFRALQSLPNIIRILLTVTLEFEHLDYYQGEM